jgi:hypothetical protein
MKSRNVWECRECPECPECGSTNITFDGSTITYTLGQRTKRIGAFDCAECGLQNIESCIAYPNNE